MASYLVRETDTLRWRERLLRIGWWTVLIIVLAELSVFAITLMTGSQQDSLAHLITYVVIPGGCICAVMAVAQVLSRRLMARERFAAQAYVFVLGASVVALCIAWTHRAAHTAHAVFIVPILLSYVFVNRRPQWFAFALNVCLYAAFSIVLYRLEPDVAPSFIENCMIFTILLISQLIGMLMYDRQISLIESVAEATRMSMTDSLTRLYNHAAFYEHLDQRILCHARGEGGFCLIIFDIDDFKRINDRYGHDVGDEVLLALVATVNACTQDEDRAYRYGGEEFTILTPNSIEASHRLAEDIRKGFAERVTDVRRELRATVSAGVCAYDPSVCRGRREFFASADEALYEAKRTGKDKVVIWSRKLLERPHSMA